MFSLKGCKYVLSTTQAPTGGYANVIATCPDGFWLAQWDYYQGSVNTYLLSAFTFASTINDQTAPYAISVTTTQPIAANQQYALTASAYCCPRS